ncbi:hypothetical protein Tco_1054131 [Tanacetum coccineum]|uniref:Uncharacterized protein n=1 Tax=Tanacetum coccineum TaxID=301880 RepID=A0ABQ5GWT1_9ASTR
MSTPTHPNSEISSQTVGAQSSQLPTPFPDDPYVAVRQTHLVDTDTESDQEETPSEVEEFQPLVSRAPLTDEEFEVSKPSDARITPSHSSASSNSTTPLLPGTDIKEKDEKRSQNNKTRLGMEKQEKTKSKSKPKPEKVNPSQPRQIQKSTCEEI